MAMFQMTQRNVLVGSFVPGASPPSGDFSQEQLIPDPNPTAGAEVPVSLGLRTWTLS